MHLYAESMNHRSEIFMNNESCINLIVKKSIMFWCCIYDIGQNVILTTLLYNTTGWQQEVVLHF